MNKMLFKEPQRRRGRRGKSLVFYFLPVTFYFLLCILPAFAETIKNSCPNAKIVLDTKHSHVDVTFKDWDKNCGDPGNFLYSFEDMVSELVGQDIVYLGETHDKKEDHQNQLKIIQELYKRNSKIAIAMEMFQHPYQGIIDRYLAGKITEEELLKKSEYEKRWGFPWENYAPIVRFAKDKKLPIIALNVPSEITRKVARQGLESLTLSERQLIPPLSEIRTDNKEYREKIQAIFQQHQTSGHGNSANFERFFQAQILWDETMAEGVAKFIKANPKYQVVVLAGQGHIVYGYGIPNRVARRLKGKTLFQRSVLLSSPEETNSAKGTIADYIIYLSDLPQRAKTPKSTLPDSQLK